MDIEEFKKTKLPAGRFRRRSRLLPFKAQILDLMENGYAYFQIQEWLASNNVVISIIGLQKFVEKILKEQKVNSEKSESVQAHNEEVLASQEIEPSIPSKTSKEDLSKINLREMIDESDKKAREYVKSSDLDDVINYINKGKKS